MRDFDSRDKQNKMRRNKKRLINCNQGKKNEDLAKVREKSKVVQII